MTSIPADVFAHLQDLENRIGAIDNSLATGNLTQQQQAEANNAANLALGEYKGVLADIIRTTEDMNGFHNTLQETIDLQNNPFAIAGLTQGIRNGSRQLGYTTGTAPVTPAFGTPAGSQGGFTYSDNPTFGTPVGSQGRGFTSAGGTPAFGTPAGSQGRVSPSRTSTGRTAERTSTSNKVPPPSRALGTTPLPASTTVPNKIGVMSSRNVNNLGDDVFGFYQRISKVLESYKSKTSPTSFLKAVESVCDGYENSGAANAIEQIRSALRQAIPRDFDEQDTKGHAAIGRVVRNALRFVVRELYERSSADTGFSKAVQLIVLKSTKPEDVTTPKLVVARYGIFPTAKKGLIGDPKVLKKTQFLFDMAFTLDSKKEIKNQLQFLIRYNDDINKLDKYLSKQGLKGDVLGYIDKMRVNLPNGQTQVIERDISLSQKDIKIHRAIFTRLVVNLYHYFLAMGKRKLKSNEIYEAEASKIRETGFEIPKLMDIPFLQWIGREQFTKSGTSVFPEIRRRVLAYGTNPDKPDEYYPEGVNSITANEYDEMIQILGQLTGTAPGQAVTAVQLGVANIAMVKGLFSLASAYGKGGEKLTVEKAGRVPKHMDASDAMLATIFSAQFPPAYRKVGMKGSKKISAPNTDGWSAAQVYNKDHDVTEKASRKIKSMRSTNAPLTDKFITFQHFTGLAAVLSLPDSAPEVTQENLPPNERMMLVLLKTKLPDGNPTGPILYPGSNITFGRLRLLASIEARAVKSLANEAKPKKK